MTSLVIDRSAVISHNPSCELSTSTNIRRMPCEPRAYPRFRPIRATDINHRNPSFSAPALGVYLYKIIVFPIPFLIKKITFVSILWKLLSLAVKEKPRDSDQRSGTALWTAQGTLAAGGRGTATGAVEEFSNLSNYYCQGMVETEFRMDHLSEPFSKRQTEE